MRLQLEVRRDDEGRLSGSVGVPSKEQVAFVGVLGFVTAVERCLEGRRDGGSPVEGATHEEEGGPT